MACEKSKEFTKTVFKSSVCGAWPNPARGTQLLDIPQSLELFAGYFQVRQQFQTFHEKRYTDVSMKDASFGVTGTGLVISCY